jgi:hypothetical protein
MVHLVNYRADTPVTNAIVHLAIPPGKSPTSVQLTSPEHQQIEIIAYQEQAGSLTFTVPKVNVYEVAVVEFRAD